MILLPLKNKKNEVLFSLQIITEFQPKGRRNSLQTTSRSNLRKDRPASASPSIFNSL